MTREILDWAANSARSFVGFDLDGDHQDHLVRRKSIPDGNGFLFSYEGYDTITGQFIRPNVTGKQPLTIEADRAMILVLAPAAGRAVRDGGKLKINDVVIDHCRGQ